MNPVAIAMSVGPLLVLVPEFSSYLGRKKRRRQRQCDELLKVEYEKLYQQQLERQLRVIDREANRRIDKLARDYQRRLQ